MCDVDNLIVLSLASHIHFVTLESDITQLNVSQFKSTTPLHQHCINTHTTLAG